MSKSKTLSLICLICLTGCAPIQMVPTSISYRVSINAISSGEALLVGKKYCIVSGMKDISSEDLQFKEYAQYVKRAMLIKGFQVVDSEKESDGIVFLGYGVSEPKEKTRAYSTPIWGQTGISSSYTSGTINNVGGMASYSGTTTYTPAFGVVGSETHFETYDTYARHIVLSAYDAAFYRETKKEKHLWKLEITNTGSNGDLRRVFPILMAAASKYIGEDTKRTIKTAITSDSEEVDQIKGGGFAAP